MRVIICANRNLAEIGKLPRGDSAEIGKLPRGDSVERLLLDTGVFQYYSREISQIICRTLEPYRAANAQEYISIEIIEGSVNYIDSDLFGVLQIIDKLIVRNIRATSHLNIPSRINALTIIDSTLEWTYPNWRMNGYSPSFTMDIFGGCTVIPLAGYKGLAMSMQITAIHDNFTYMQIFPYIPRGISIYLDLSSVISQTILKFHGKIPVCKQTGILSKLSIARQFLMGE